MKHSPPGVIAPCALIGAMLAASGAMAQATPPGARAPEGSSGTTAEGASSPEPTPSIGDDTAARPAPSTDPGDLEVDVRTRLRSVTLRLVTERREVGTAVLVASDGLIATAAHLVGDVGVGCTVFVFDSNGRRYDAVLLDVDSAADMAILRARDLVGRVGLRLSARSPVRGQRVFVPSMLPGGLTLVEGSVESATMEDIRLRLPATPPRATGGPVVTEHGHLLGMLQRPEGGASPAYVTALLPLRTSIETLRREYGPAACAPPYGQPLRATWHLGVEFAASISTLQTARAVYSARFTALWMERWYVRTAVGVSGSDGPDLHFSLSGGPVLFRTRNDGVVAFGARVDGEFGPLNMGFTGRHEFYALELHATGYASPFIGISANLAGGLDRRSAEGSTVAAFGGAFVIGVGVVLRTDTGH